MVPPILRKLISRLLMKLPSFLFPNYRVAMEQNPQETNSSRNRSFETCKHFLARLLKRKKVVEASSPLIEPEAERLTTILSWADEVEKERQGSLRADESSSSLLIDNQTPPLRRITLDEIKSVRLKPILKVPKNTKKDEMEEVLKKRFDVMHSVNNSLNDSEDLFLSSELCRP